MNQKLSFRMFAHSWRSDWNHGNAHFLRGLAHELIKLGHEVRCYEEEDSWSYTNLLDEGETGKQSLRTFARVFPLDVRIYRKDIGFVEFARRELRGADIVLVHEWTDPAVANSIVLLKRELGFRALFHDTHHRAYTSPKEIANIHLERFDGVLSFGEALTHIYRDAFGVERIWTFHEAADTAHFYPRDDAKSTDVLWIGNWGDEERTRELEEFLIGPAAELPDRRFAAYGVRYPDDAQVRLQKAQIQYRGYLPNLEVPATYASSAVTVHIPRRCYSNGLSGIPTIRVFETLACGMPLVCSPWTDVDQLFRAGEDYICVPDGRCMAAEINSLLNDELARQQLASNGLQTIHRRHTCAHRAEELLLICGELART